MTLPSTPTRACISKRMSFEPSYMVTIQVGKPTEHKDFVAHESFLTSRSEFFLRAMNGNWAEGESRVVKLPEDVPDYLNMVYTGQLVTMRKTQEELSGLDAKACREQLHVEFEDLFRLYVLAKKLQDTGAKNAALVAAIDVSGAVSSAKTWFVPTIEVVKLVCGGTPKSSPGRRLVIDMYGMHEFKSLMKVAQQETLDKDAFDDLAKVFDKTRQLKQGYTGNWVAKGGVQTYLEEERLIW